MFSLKAIVMSTMAPTNYSGWAEPLTWLFLKLQRALSSAFKEALLPTRFRLDSSQWPAGTERNSCGYLLPGVSPTAGDQTLLV